LATTEFVLANSDPVPDLTNYAQKTLATLQTFTGPITLNGITNGVTATLGDNSTLLATTEFVLANSDPVPDLSNYAQKTLATLQTFTGPITLNGATTLGANLNSNGFSLNNINTLNIGNSITNFSTINQSGIQMSIFNNAPYTGGTSNIAFSLLNNISAPTIPLQIYSQSIGSNVLLDMRTNSITNANLGTGCTAITQSSGNNSTAIATTAFVQDAVQVAGVQTTDSPLLWQGANTWQYNAGTSATLPYSYPYGISNLWNITGGNGDCNFVCNSGTGSLNSAFNIYCVQGDTTGTELRTLTPQLILSNNGTAMQVKDGINIPTGEIFSINNNNIFNNTSLTGTPTAPTQSSSNNSTAIATTAFVQSVLPVTTITQLTNNDPTNLSFSTNPLFCSTLQQGGLVTFTLSFSTTIIGSGIDPLNPSLASFSFSGLPFPQYPPANLYPSINAFCSTNGTNYSCIISFNPTNAGFYIQPTGFPPLTIGTTFNFVFGTYAS
jgi:hypothetical protein